MTKNVFLRTTLAVAAAAAILVPLTPTPTEAQGGRFRVLVADLKPTDNTRTRFGERAGERLRDILDTSTHVAVSTGDVNRAGRDYDIRHQDLDCIKALQMATLMSLNLVVCGDYHTENGAIRYSAKIITVPGGEEFSQTFDPIPENQDRQAGDQIMAFFTETGERLNTIAFCLEDFSTSNWQGALDYCSRALQAAPNHREARFAYGRTLMEVGRHAEALEQFEMILENDQFNTIALQTAGWLAAQLGEREQARDYYARYLQLNPTDVPVRIQVANDLASAGDNEGAMRLLEGGFEQDSMNVDLHLMYGALATRAAVDRENEWMATQPPVRAGEQPTLPPEIQQLYRTAIRSYTIVLDARGPETRPEDVVSMLRAYLKIGDIDGAVALADRIVTFFREHPMILGELAVTYQRGGFIDRSIEFMERALEVDPNLPDARFRMANFLLGAQRDAEAIEWARRALEKGEREPDAVGGLLLQIAYSERAQKGHRQEAIRLFEAAKALPGISSGFRSQVNFFHGFTLFQEAEQMQAPSTEQSARASLPIFRDQVLPLLEQAREYADANGQGASLQSMVDGTNTYIQIQEAIIARAERAAG